MQIIVLEYDVRYNNAYKENLESDFKLLNENYRLKEDEVNFLRNRIASLESESGVNTEELFYQELNKIRDLLREKTTELVKLDQFHNQTHNLTKNKVNQFKDENVLLINENEKLKEILKDILSFHSNGEKKELDNLLNYLNNNNALFNAKEPEQININNNNNIVNTKDESNSKDLSGNDNANNNSAIKNEEFTEKVLNEFDKIFQDEMKRVERFFKKDSIHNNKTTESSLKRKASFRRKGSAEKNYFEWKSKSQNESWAGTLRGRDPAKKQSQNDFNPASSNENINQGATVDIENKVEHIKNRLRNSLKSYENLNLNTGSINNFNYTSFYSTKNIITNNTNNNFYFGKDNNSNNNYNKSHLTNNSNSRNLNNIHIRDENNSYISSNNNHNQLMRTNSNSNLSSGIKYRGNQSQSPDNSRNTSIKHSSNKKELKGRE